MSQNYAINDRTTLIGQLKQELSQRLEAVQAPLLAHREAAGTLRAMGLQAGNINTYTAFTSVVSDFLKVVESTLTEVWRGAGNARIEVSDTRADFGFQQFRASEMTGHDRPLNEQADSLVSKYPFEQLADELIRQCRELEAKGLADIANRLGNHLGLFVGFYNRDDPFLPFKSGRMICHFSLERSFMGTEYNRTVIEGLGRMTTNFQAVEHEMGLTGLSESIKAIAGTLESGLQPPRTKLNGGGTIEAVVFKEHMHLRFTAEAADGLLAFVALHKTRDLEIMGLRGVAA